MKKLIISFIIIFLGLSAIKAQITLEHTYKGIYVKHTNNSPFTSDVSMLYWLDTHDLKFYLYNDDHSLYKVVSLPSYSPNYRIFSVLFVSKRLFNNDSLIEFVIYYMGQQGGSNNKEIVFNENGEIIKNFDGNYKGLYKSSDNKYRYVLWKNTPHDTEIYKLPGTIETSVNEVYTQQDLPAPYPNPTHKEITIPYHLNSKKTDILQVYDINGNLINKIVVDKKNKSVKLNVSYYHPGVYFYIVNGIKNKFIVQ